ncbi:MAG TPA: glycosyltransferase family 2 protein [Planctomycetota bacterium]
MAETHAVAALLLNWRRASMTVSCLRDLLATTGAVLQVLVIDNGSGDDSEDVLQKAVHELGAAAAPHRIEFEALAQNVGFAGGMNHGLRWAGQRSARYVLVLNNDVRLGPDFLAPLVTVLDNDPGVAAVGPTVLYPDGRVWAEGGRTGFMPNAVRLCGHGKAPHPREHGPEAVEFLPAACVLFRTAELAAIGGFDEDYFMYWEDVDLCDRLRARGGRIVWLPWVRVEHAPGQSSGGGRSPLRKFLMANNAVRWLRRRGTLRTWAGWFLFDVLGWPLSLLSGPRGGWAKLRGTLAGLGGHRASAGDVERYLRSG